MAENKPKKLEYAASGKATEAPNHCEIERVGPNQYRMSGFGICPITVSGEFLQNLIDWCDGNKIKSDNLEWLRRRWNDLHPGRPGPGPGRTADRPALMEES